MIGGRGLELSLTKSPVSPARQPQLAGAGLGSLLTPLLQLGLGSGRRLRWVLRGHTSTYAGSSTRHGASWSSWQVGTSL